MGGQTRSPVDLMRRAARERAPVELDPGTLLLSRHGTEIQIAGSAAPIRNHQGEPGGAVLVFGSAKSEDAEPRAPAMNAEAAAKPLSSVPFEIVYESEIMRQIMAFLRRVASSEASTILLEGESGTGKDVFAKYLHYNSRRKAEPFIAINCAAIPETLLESELFGYEKGAFTDARAQKKGLFELADKGTLFLDEIGEIPLSLQAKLLRVLEEQTFRRLGGLRDIKVDLRIIAATNKNLREAVKEGAFRQDLYFR